jgi:hypothetical protein
LADSSCGQSLCVYITNLKKRKKEKEKAWSYSQKMMMIYVQEHANAKK